MNPTYIIIAIAFGFYLGRFDQVNQKVAEKLPEIQKRLDRARYKPSVIRPNETELEKEQELEEEKDELSLRNLLPR